MAYEFVLTMLVITSLLILYVVFCITILALIALLQDRSEIAEQAIGSLSGLAQKILKLTKPKAN